MTFRAANPVHHLAKTTRPHTQPIHIPSHEARYILQWPTPSTATRHKTQTTWSSSIKAKTTKAGLFFRTKVTSAPPRSHHIHNLSSVPLSPADIELLSKGLSFSPTPEHLHDCHPQILTCFEEFARSLRLQYHNHNTSLRSSQPPLHVAKSHPVYHKMKFLRKCHTDHPLQNSVIMATLKIIFMARDSQLQNLYSPTTNKITKAQRNSLQNSQSHQT